MRGLRRRYGSGAQAHEAVRGVDLALPPLGVLLAWTALALAVARRSLRWEPRT